MTLIYSCIYSFVTVVHYSITILDIIYRPGFYFKHNVSKTGFCRRLQTKLSYLGPVDGASLCLRTWSGPETETSSIY
jgi:hypothetical protein